MARPKKGKRRPTPQTVRNMDQVMELRAKGFTLKQIAHQLNLSITRVHELQQQAVEMIPRENTETWLRIELDRLDDIYLRSTIEAGRRAKDGREFARYFDTALRAVEQQSRLLRLDREVERDQTNEAATLLETLISNSVQAMEEA